MTPETEVVVHLDLHRKTITPLQIQLDREAWARSQRRRRIWVNIFTGAIASLALCVLLLLLLNFGWLS